MSMDDMQELAAAIVSGREIQLADETGAVKHKASVLFATLHCDHQLGIFSGSVNYHIEGEQYMSIDAFYNLWKAGWQPKPQASVKDIWL